MITAEQLKDLLEREKALRGGIFDVDARSIRLEEEELRTQSPDFWSDTKAAEAQMKVVRELKFWLNAYNEVKAAVDELQLAYDFMKEGVVSEEEADVIYAKALKIIEDLELKNMLRREEDQLGAVLKVNAGAGGTESQDWASMLFRMYQRWCEDKNYKTTVTNWQDGDDAGIKTATLQVEGDLPMAS